MEIHAHNVRIRVSLYLNVFFSVVIFCWCMCFHGLYVINTPNISSCYMGHYITVEYFKLLHLNMSDHSFIEIVHLSLGPHNDGRK